LNNQPNQEKAKLFVLEVGDKKCELVIFGKTLLFDY
jgi:hypothetical protein